MRKREIKLEKEREKKRERERERGRVLFCLKSGPLFTTPNITFCQPNGPINLRSVTSTYR